MKTSRYLLFLLPVFLASGCKKLDLAPVDRFSDLTFWKAEENVNNALNNNYSGMYNSAMYFFNEALSDNAVAATEVVASGSFNSSLPKFLNDWSFYYQGIKSCNLFLTYVDENATLPAATIARMKGEVRFIRAFHHFNLMKLYGDIPLVNFDISPEQAQTIGRTPKAEVAKFIIDELADIASFLPKKEETDNGRITKAAALALEARVLLYEGNRMAEVATICEDLMNNQSQYGAYSLNPGYIALFNDLAVNKNNPEAILSLQYVPEDRTWSEYFDFAPRSAGARTSAMAPTQELVNNYILLNGRNISDAGSGYNENNPYTNRDPRLTATVVYDRYVWTNPDGSTQIIYIRPGSDPNQPGLNEYNPSAQSSPTGYFWHKYYDRTSVANQFKSGLNLHLIRYAEVLLMYAEAKNSLGQMDEAVWNSTIRALRQRAGFTDPAALNYPGNANMTEIIRTERRSELAMEGFRTDDIRRWKIAEVVLNGYAHGARFGDPGVDNGYIRAERRQFDPAKNYLWPIPASEIALNPNLAPQNSGY